LPDRMWTRPERPGTHLLDRKPDFTPPPRPFSAIRPRDPVGSGACSELAHLPPPGGNPESGVSPDEDGPGPNDFGTASAKGHVQRSPPSNDRTAVGVTGARAVVAAVFAVLSAACAGGDGFGGPPQVGEPAPPFAAPSLIDGDTVSIASLQGRPLVVNLWATWCPPCREETPYLQSIYDRHRDAGLQMVGITVDGRSAAGAAREFLEQSGATYLQLHDPGMRVLDVFKVIGLPATYVFDSEGIVRFSGNRPVFEGDAEFEGALAAVLEPGS